MHGFSHKPARVVRRAYLASTRQHQHQENENHPAANNEQEFLSCQSNSETTNWPKAENLGQIERWSKACCVPGCRVAEGRSVLLSKGAAGKLPARPTRSCSGRWRALAKGTAWAALFSLSSRGNYYWSFSLTSIGSSSRWFTQGNLSDLRSCGRAHPRGRR